MDDEGVDSAVVKQLGTVKQLGPMKDWGSMKQLRAR